MRDVAAGTIGLRGAGLFTPHAAPDTWAMTPPRTDAPWTSSLTFRAG